MNLRFKQLNRILSDTTEQSTDADGNLITTRTIVTKTTPEELQAKQDEIDAKIASLQEERASVSVSLTGAIGK